MQTSVSTVERNVEMINTWLRETSEELGGIGEENAWARLRAVLQTLRDRIPVDDAAHFAAQLPVIARGIFYEGWNPSETPHKWRDKDEYVNAINQKMTGRDPVGAEETLRAVLRVIERHVDPAEVAKLKKIHPKEVWGLWPS